MDPLSIPITLPEKKDSNTLRFEVDAALLFELGEQLVARRSIALAELIKNAYDADATEVTVTFDNVSQASGSIIVTDNGLGMTLEALRTGWMRIATRNKIDNPISPRFGRARTGAKGIGRLAARKLAHRLSIESTTERAPSTWDAIDLKIDWDQFKAGRDLDEITAEFSHREYAEPRATGVRLVLSGLRDVWAEADIREVRNDLVDLVPPFPPATKIAAAAPASYERDPGFHIRLESAEFPRQEGELGEQFLSAASARLTGSVIEGAIPEYRLRMRGADDDEVFRPNEISFPNLVAVEFVIHHFKYSPDSIGDSDIRLGRLRELGRQFGGVKIYLDGFRVFPYGDAGDDWLKLDEDRARRITGVDTLLRNLIPAEFLTGSRPMLLLPGNNRVFGAVFISRRMHPTLTPNISRERLLENESFRQLRRFVRLGIDWMTVKTEAEEWRQNGENFRSITPPSPPNTHYQPLTTHITLSEMVTQATEDLKRQVSAVAGYARAAPIISQLESLSQTVRLREEEQISKVAMYRILASAGTTLVIFNHQMRAIIDGLRRLATDFDELQLVRDIESTNIMKDMRSQLRFWLEVIEAQATQLGLLLGTDSRRRRRSLAVRPIVEQVLATFSLYCREYGIEAENSVPANVRTPPLYPAELYSLLLNVVTNSLKAVKDQPVRRIDISAQDASRGFLLLVRDTGKGILVEDRNRVFEPFVTTTTPDPVLGVGTGLGLAIVHDIVQEHRGTAKFVDAAPPWNTAIEIEIPHGVDG